MSTCSRDAGRSNGTGNPPTDATSTAVRAFLHSLRPLQPLLDPHVVNIGPPTDYVEALTGVKLSTTSLGPSRRSLGQQRRWKRERGTQEERKSKENKPRNTQVDSKRGVGQRARQQRELAAEIQSLQCVPAVTRTAADSQTLRRRVERAHKMLDADRDCGACFHFHLSPDPDSTLENQLAKFIYNGGSLAKYGPYVPIEDSIPEVDTMVGTSIGNPGSGDKLVNSGLCNATFASGSDDATSAVIDNTMLTGNLRSGDTLDDTLEDEGDGDSWAYEDYSMWN